MEFGGKDLGERQLEFFRLAVKQQLMQELDTKICPQCDKSVRQHGFPFTTAEGLPLGYPDKDGSKWIYYLCKGNTMSVRITMEIVKSK